MLSDALDGQGRKARFGIMVPGWGGRLSDDQQLSRHKLEVALFQICHAHSIRPVRPLPIAC